MADNIPQIDLPTVAPQSVRLSEASPGAFGAGVGQAVSQAGQGIGEIAINERHMAASFDAQDRELKYGEANDRLEEQFKNDLKNPPADADFQKWATGRLQKLMQDRADLRSKFEGTLGDPLARKAYSIRTRIQTQAADRQALLFMDTHIDKWREQTNEGLQAHYIDQAGNMTGFDAQHDMSTFSVNTSLAHDAYDQAHPNEPDEYRIQKKLDIDKKAAIKAFDAFGDNYDAAMAFLGGKTNQGIRVGFDPKHPEEPSILNADETSKLQRTFTEIKDNKVGTNAGAAWFFNGVKDPNAEARKEIAAGRMTPEAAGKAVDRYSSLQGHQFAAVEHARTMATQSAAAAIVEYGGYEEAKAANKIPKNADVGSLLGVDNRFSIHNSKPILGRLDAVIGDPGSVGWSLSVKHEDFVAKLYASGMQQSQINKYEREYAKDGALATASAKSPGMPQALGNIRDAVRQALGVSQITGKNTSDLKPWQRDVQMAAEMELAHRVSGAAVKAGTKVLPTEDTIKIAKEVADLIPGWKEQAKHGQNVIPNYQDAKATEVSDAQKTAGAKVLSAFANPGQQTSPDLKGHIVLTAADPRIPGSKPGEEYDEIAPNKFKRVK